MERLTRKLPGGYAMAEGYALDTLKGVRAAVNRLAAYEDTGLTPEEVQQMQWIPVEERLPEQENTQVLMTDGECHYISSRNNMVRFLDCEGIFIPGKAGAGVKVTHWMPLPKAPKEETHEK